MSENKIIQLKIGEVLNWKTLAENQKRLVDFANKLSGQDTENIELRRSIERAATPEQIIKIINGLKKDGDDDSVEYVNELINEIKTISKSLDADPQNRNFAAFVKDISDKMKNTERLDDKNYDASLMTNYLKNATIDPEAAKKQVKDVNVNSKKDVDVSLDFLQSQEDGSSGKTLATNIQNFFEVENNGLTAKEDMDPVAFASAIKNGLVDDLISEQNVLQLQIENSNKNLKTLAVAAISGSDEDKKAYNDAFQEQKKMEESLAAVVKTLRNIESFGKETPALANQIKGALEKAAKQNKQNEQRNVINDLDKEAEKVKGSFDILGQGTRSFGSALDAATSAVGQLENAFGNMGDNMKGLNAVNGYANSFVTMLTSLAKPVLAFGAAMALAGKAIGDYHEQLNIGRSMGSGDDGMVRQLQDMHIRSLMDPGQLKELSDSISGNFNVSLSGNRKEMERIATKQRLSERVMGKEYAADQMAAINEMKTVLEGQSPADMMDDLTAQTSALAKTMGISNKMALEQIKAIHENTKIITKGMNRDVAKKIEDTMQGMAASMKEAGYSEEYIKETLEYASQAAADDEAASDSMHNLIQVMEMGGAGAELMSAGLDKLGMSQAQAQKLQADRLLLGFDGLSSEDKKKYLEIEKLNKQAQEALYADLSDKADKGIATAKEQSMRMMISQNKNFQKSSETANKIADVGVQGIIDAEQRGKKQREILKASADAQPDLDKLLVTMGATDNESRKEMLEQLKKQVELQGDEPERFKENKKQLMEIAAASQNIKDYENMTPDQLKKALIDSGLTENDVEQIDTDAWTTTVGERLSKEVKEMEKKGTGSFGGVEGALLKSTVKDPDYEEKRVAASGTKAENAKDKLERVAVTAQYKAQNAIMGVVNTTLDSLNDALKWLKDNLDMVIMALSGVAAGFLGFKASKLFGGPAASMMKQASTVVGGFITSVTKGLVNAHTSLFKGIGGMFSGVGTFFKDKILTPIGSKIGEVLGPLKDKFMGMFSGITSALSGSRAGTSAADAFVGPPSPPDQRSFWKKVKDGVSKGVKGIGGALKGLGSTMMKSVGPMALIGAAMTGLQGAMEGWGKAGEWFNITNSKKDVEEVLSKQTEYSEALAKSIDPTARWNAEQGKYVDATGKVIEAQKTHADLLKTAPIDISNMTAEELKKNKAQIESSQKAQELAASLSKTGKALWDGSKYVDEYGRTIEAQPSFMQKAASGVGGALEALTFGMLDGQHMAHKTGEAFKWLGAKMDEIGLSEAFTEIGKAMGEMMSTIWKAIKPVVLFVGEVLSPVFGFLGQVFKTAFQYVSGFIDIFSGVIKIFSGDFSGAFDSITDGFGTMLDGLYGLVSGFFKGIGGIFDALGLGFIGDGFRWVGEVISDVGGVIVDFVKNPMDSLKNGLKSIGDFIGIDLAGIFDAYVAYFKTIFNSLYDGITSVFGGLVDIITAPFKNLYDFFSGDKTFFEAITGMFDDMVDGLKTILDGMFDIVYAPFKGILAWMDEFFGTSMLEPFMRIKDGIMGALDGLIDAIMAPFEGLIAWFNGEMDFSEAMEMAWESAKAGFVKVFEGMQDALSGLIEMIASPFKKFIGWIQEKLANLGIIDSVEEEQANEIVSNASEKDKKAGDALVDKLNFNGGWTQIGDRSEDDIRKIVSENNLTEKQITQLVSSDETSADEKEMLVTIMNEMKKEKEALQKEKEMGYREATVEGIKSSIGDIGKAAGDDLAKTLKINGYFDTSEKTIRKRVAAQGDEIGLEQLRNLIASDETDDDEKDILVKILNERLAAAAPQKVEVTTLPAKAEGGSTGGLGDAFAKMILPDTNKEKPVATVGPDEFVFSKDMIQDFMRVRDDVFTTGSVGKAPEQSMYVSDSIKNVGVSTVSGASSMESSLSNMERGSDGAKYLERSLNEIGLTVKESQELQSKTMLMGFSSLTQDEKEKYLEINKLTKQAYEIDYNTLSKSIDNGTATTKEKSEFMLMKYQTDREYSSTKPPAVSSLEKDLKNADPSIKETKNVEYADPAKLQNAFLDWMSRNSHDTAKLQDITGKADFTLSTILGKAGKEGVDSLTSDELDSYILLTRLLGVQTEEIKKQTTVVEASKKVADKNATELKKSIEDSATGQGTVENKKSDDTRVVDKKPGEFDKEFTDLKKRQEGLKKLSELHKQKGNVESAKEFERLSGLVGEKAKGLADKGARLIKEEKKEGKTVVKKEPKTKEEKRMAQREDLYNQLQEGKIDKIQFHNQKNALLAGFESEDRQQQIKDIQSKIDNGTATDREKGRLDNLKESERVYKEKLSNKEVSTTVNGVETSAKQKIAEIGLGIPNEETMLEKGKDAIGKIKDILPAPVKSIFGSVPQSGVVSQESRDVLNNAKNMISSPDGIMNTFSGLLPKEIREQISKKSSIFGSVPQSGVVSQESRDVLNNAKNMISSPDGIMNTFSGLLPKEIREQVSKKSIGGDSKGSMIGGTGLMNTITKIDESILGGSGIASSGIGSLLENSTDITSVMGAPGAGDVKNVLNNITGGSELARGASLPSTSGSIPISPIPMSSSVAGGTTNNVTNNNETKPDSSNTNIEKLLTQLVDESLKQSKYLGISSKEAVNLTKQAQRTHKANIDRADNDRQHTNESKKNMVIR